MWVAPGDDRAHQRQHLATRERATLTAVETNPLVDQRLQAQPLDQRADQDQPGVAHQLRVVEDRFVAVDVARDCRHRKCLPDLGL